MLKHSNRVIYTRFVSLNICGTSNLYKMKKFILSFAAASFSVASFAQDAPSQPAGSWYLGSGDATQMLSIFSGGVDIMPTVG